MKHHLPLGPGAEFDAVRALLARWGSAATGVGDDGAVLEVPVGERLVASTDSSVEGVHFKREWLTPEEIGWRATSAALSDLAAMGAAPLGVLLALTVPAGWRADLISLADGIAAATRAAGIPIIGGDVTDGERLSFAITVLGHTPRVLSRAGARAGDTLYVTGRLGGPGAALKAWQRGEQPSAEARERFARPVARVAAGAWLVRHGAHAAIDVSDGLAGDVTHLAAASAVRCVLALDAIPRMMNVSPDDALASGEEYELLVAAPSLDVGRFAAENGGLTLTAIGRVEAAQGVGEVVAERDGALIGLPSTHDHFAR